MTQFSSRPPFNDDPTPIVHPSGKRTEILSFYSEFEPRESGPFGRIAKAAYDARPEFDRPQTNPTNPILELFREYVVDPGDGGLGWCAALWIRCFDGELDETWSVFQMLRDREPESATVEHYGHARRVLTRLASLA